jgi:hypothetical protein
VPDHSPYARRLREIADALDAKFQPADDALSLAFILAGHPTC